MGMTIGFMIIYAQNLLAMRESTLSPLAGSLYFFDNDPFSASQEMAKDNPSIRA
jgi:hypothetical protein